jgi:transcriptional regulator with XRE-family HTH domain
LAPLWRIFQGQYTLEKGKIMSELDIRNIAQLREQAETWRFQRGWTQLEMAQALNIGLQTYGNFKRGQSSLLKATRIRLVDLLNARPNGGENSMVAQSPPAPSPYQGLPLADAQPAPSAPASSGTQGAPTDAEIVQALALAQTRQRPDYIQELGAMAVRLTRLKRLAEEERTKLEHILDDLDRRNNGK